MKRKHFLVVAGCGLLAGAVLYSQGCGDNSTLPVDFQGNVVSVEGGASASKKPSKNFLVELRPLDRLRGFWTTSAAAQSGVCSTATQASLNDVLACVQTSRTGASTPAPSVTPTPIQTTTPGTTPTVTGTPGTPTPTFTPTAATPRPTLPGGSATCTRVDMADCTFSTEVELAHNGDPAVVFFVRDTNGNGTPDSGEPEAVLANPFPFPLCNGDVVELSNVDVNFQNQTATASAVGKLVDACPAPTRTVGPTHTPAPSATATRTGTPATATPTRTPGYYYAATSLNRPPSTLMALLSSLAIVGLLLPPRRRSRRPFESAS